MSDGPTHFPFIDHFPNCGRCPTVFATVYEDEDKDEDKLAVYEDEDTDVYEDEEEDMPRRDGKYLEDLSHTMARVLRRGRCHHNVNGFVEIGQLARYLRVPYNDVAAVVGAQHRDDEEFYFERAVHDGKVWVGCITSRRRAAAEAAEAEAAEEAEVIHIADAAGGGPSPTSPG